MTDNSGIFVSAIICVLFVVFWVIAYRDELVDSLLFRGVRPSDRLFSVINCLYVSWPLVVIVLFFF